MRQIPKWTSQSFAAHRIVTFISFSLFYFCAQTESAPLILVRVAGECVCVRVNWKYGSCVCYGFVFIAIIITVCHCQSVFYVSLKPHKSPKVDAQETRTTERKKIRFKAEPIWETNECCGFIRNGTQLKILCYCIVPTQSSDNIMHGSETEVSVFLCQRTCVRSVSVWDVPAKDFWTL